MMQPEKTPPWRIGILLCSLLVALCSASLEPTPAIAQNWPQWGHDPQHTGMVNVVGQDLNRLLADLIYDPFVAREKAFWGALLVHYQVPLVDGDDVFMLFKTGSWSPITWNTQIWNEKRFHWESGQLVEKWTFESDWKPVPDPRSLGGWEPVFQPVLVGSYLYVPGFDGTIFKLNREDGTVVSRIDPFRSRFSGRDKILRNFVAGPLSADHLGNVYYNVVRLNPPPTNKVWGAWLIKVAPDDTTAKATYASLTRGVETQRPGVNVAPAIAPDSTIYTVSRHHVFPGPSFLVAVNPDLSPKWVAQMGPVVTDQSSSSPTVAPDGSVLYGGLGPDPTYRGVLLHFSPTGEFLNSYDFGWDITPAIYAHDGTYSIIIKDNHYETAGPYYITRLTADLTPEWQFENPNGMEWCINAPAVDRNGVVHTNGEDGYLYTINQDGTLKQRIFLILASGAAYTPLSIGNDGKIYTQSNGHLFVVGQ